MKFPKGMTKEKNTIGFVAPSFGCATEPYLTGFNVALERWEKSGYRTKLGPNCYASDGIGISSTPENCGHELTDMYCDQEADAIISCGGGELMCGILDHVNFDQVSQNNPKWYMGYSDNTNFTFTLTTMCDVASIYGPCAASFGADDLCQCHADAMCIISDEKYETPGILLRSDNSYMDEKGIRHYKFAGYGRWESAGIRDEEHPLAGYNLNEETHLRRMIGNGNSLSASKNIRPDSTINTVDEKVQDNVDENITPQQKLTEVADILFESHQYTEPDSISMKGRLIGGCLDCLITLCGTKFDHVSQFADKYKNDGIIWYLEACDLNVLSMRRAIWQLDHAGWFEGVSGFIIGRPLHFAEPIMGMDHYMAFYDALTKYNVPILMDADIGHLSPMVPVINGSLAYVEAHGNEWTIDMALR